MYSRTIKSRRYFWGRNGSYITGYIFNIRYLCPLSNTSHCLSYFKLYSNHYTVKAGLNYQSFCNHIKNFAQVNSKF